MLKAMYFEDAFKQGYLGKIAEGYILSVAMPDLDNMDTQNDPICIEMISYSGVKSIMNIGSGVKFQAQGKKMYCMLEPATFTESHIEPTNRSQNTTGYMPYRFKECESFLTKDNKFRILIPNIPYDCYDSFTVSFPGKGDLSVLYFLFDKDVEGKVIPFMQENLQSIIRKMVALRETDAKTVSTKFIDIVKKFRINSK